MRAVLYILFGASLTVATAWALGAILLRKLGLTFYRLEERIFSFLVGSACLSAIMFVLASLKLVHKGVLLALGAAVVGYALYTKAHRSQAKPFPPLPRAWKWLFIAAFAAFTFLYFFNALAPEASPDGMSYHLGEVGKYYRAHGFVRITTNIYGNLSQGIELLYLHAFAYGKHSAAALVHFAFLVCLAFLMLSYGGRIGRPAVGVAGAIFTYASPVVGIDGSSAYIDVAVAAVAFGLFYLLQIWDEDKNARLLVPIGILTGFCFAAKYTVFLAVPYALGFIAWRLWRARQPVVRPVLATSLLALVFIAPWLVKSWILVDNPLSPFGNRLFPNRYVHVSFEDDYRRYQRAYGLGDLRAIPWLLTVKGDSLAGFVGPLFLLTPLALLALRFRAGRRLWLAAIVFALPYYTNIGTRFLIPALPFISLALALAFANLGSLLPLLVVAHAISCWPAVDKLYTSGWRLTGVPLKAALRIRPEAEFLSTRTAQYNEARLIDMLVPRGERVFAFTQIADSYTSHEILVKYQAAFNEVLSDILLTPVVAGYQPTRMLAFHFPRRELRKIRAVQTAQAKDALWGVAEMRIFAGGNELPRAPEWRLQAHPNPWDVQMAFDNSPVTRWRSWERAQPGMFIEVDFGKSQAVDAALVESSDEGYQTSVKLEGMDARGQWSTLAEHPEESVGRPKVSLRLAASAEVKSRGIRYVLVEKDDYRSEDYQFHTALWGMKFLGERGGARLYYIE